MSNQNTLLVSPVGKKKPEPEAKPVETEKDRQINFRASASLAAKLDAVADAFGVDVSNLVRLILNQNLPKYEQQADRIRRGLPPEEDKP